MRILETEIESLSASLMNEMTMAMALPNTAVIRRVLRCLFGTAARRFAEVAVGLDRIVGEQGLAAGARWVLPRFVRAHTARGVANIPADGPLVIAANHPGACDSVVISAHVTRPDYKIIIGDIPFFEKLPHVSEHAIYAPKTENLTGRMEVVRKAIRHLRNGGALLIFARGAIEPDPDCMPAPEAEFHLWSRSLQIFLKHAPQTRVLCAIASGVIAPAAMSHPITWFRKARPDRQRLAFMIQIAQQVLGGREKFGLTPRVTFGEMIGLRESGSPEQALPAVQDAARQLLKSHMAWQT